MECRQGSRLNTAGQGGVALLRGIGLAGGEAPAEQCHESTADRAVGLVHEARRQSTPASLGAMETSLGQEDVQSFALEATRAARDAASVLLDVTACELVAVHQGQLLDLEPSRGSESLRLVLHNAFAALPEDARDRPFGREVAAMTAVLGLGWATEVLVSFW